MFAARSPTFRLRDFTRIDARAAAPLAAVSVPGTYQRLDHTDAATFLEDIRFPEAARHLAFEVFSRSFFADPSQLSAAELATMFHIYFLGSSEGLIFDVPCANYDTALWQPLRGYLEGRGVRFRLATKVLSIDAATKPFRVRTDSDDHSDVDAVVLATDIAGLKRIVAASSDLGTDEWRAQISRLRTAPPFAVHRLWLDRPVRRTARRSWARPATSRSTTSACWSATNAKPATGPPRIDGSVVELHSYALDSAPSRADRATATAQDLSGNRCGTDRPREAAASQRLPAVSARRLRATGRRSARRRRACCWPATPSASTCRWHSWSGPPPPAGAPPTNSCNDGG